MELKILEESKNKIHFELIGEKHSFPNILRSELWNDEAVTISAYSLKHPLVSNPVFILETNGKKKPKDALHDAVKRLKKQNSDLKKEAEKVLK